MQRAMIRSAAAAGAASFLELPEEEEHVMNNKAFVIALRRRLQIPWPWLPQPPEDRIVCKHVGQHGRTCDCVVDPMGIHMTICKLGGGVVRRHNAIVKALATII